MTASGIDPHSIAGLLDDRGLLPSSCLAVFLGGSMARGWHHARSDADVYVVTAETWPGLATAHHPVSVSPATVPINVTYLDDRRWELRYWQDGQFDQVLEKVSWDTFQSDDLAGHLLSQSELSLLGWLDHALVIIGEEWVHHRRDQLADSAFHSLVTLRALEEAGAYADDAQGMLESGDRHAAVLAAQTALGAAADAVSLSRREYGLDGKWRARRLQAAAFPLLPFERYWELATMQSFDPVRPEVWVETVIALCRRLALEIDV